MMTGLGGLVGLVFGVGAYLMVTGFGPLHARAYVLRIERFMHPVRPRFDVGGLLATSRVDRIGQRQRRAGLAVDPSAHFLGVITWCSGGLAVGAGVIALVAAMGGLHQPVATVPFLAVCVASAWLLADRRLDSAARRRRERAVMELPTIAESLAIAVGAGAALPHAFELVAERSQGVLASELAAVVESVRRGGTIDRTLAAMTERLPVPAIGRFTDALRIALDRGTPIVDVLHAQASDARNESRRLLMERASKREIAMLIPVVFFVLPSVVVIALYPGFRELTSMV